MPGPRVPGPANGRTWGSYAGHVFALLLLCGLSTFAWLGASAWSFLVLVLDGLGNDSLTSVQSKVLINHMIFGWVAPAAVLLVGLLSVEAVGQRMAAGAAALVVATQVIALFAMFLLSM